MCWSGMTDNVRRTREGRALSRSKRRRWPTRRSALPVWNMSELRNPTIAKVMYSRKTVETWGRGIKLILDECAKANLPEPQIVAEGGYTRTVFMRPPAESEGGMKGGMKSGMKGGMRTADAIVAIIKENPQISINDIALRLSKARSAIIKQIARLKSAGILRRIGPDRGGHWETVKG